MTVNINQAVKEALALIADGFPPEDATDMAISNAGRTLSNREREYVHEGVSNGSPDLSRSTVPRI